MRFFLAVYLIFIASSIAISQSSITDLGVGKQYVLRKVNEIRNKGCTCNGQVYKPVGKLIWNQKLEESALLHAKSMHKNDFFSHFSLDGKDIGARLDDVGYTWQYAGENLAEGQKSFDEALEDWMESPTHCKMLMHPEMREMAISKYGTYWVHHLGKQMPPKTRRLRTHYSQGE